jgi:dTDP-4-dehydrorhamnose 3,5-epimerase
MKSTRLAIPDVLLLKPKLFGDYRGYFFESFNQANLLLLSWAEVYFVQDNYSRSAQEVLPRQHCRRRLV